MDSSKKDAKVIAFCGKGGAGKTSICALTIKYLMELNKKILAIDADPADGLCYALDLHPDKSLDDLRSLLSNSIKQKKISNRDELQEAANFELMSIMVEKDNLNFFKIGRPEDDGCFCSVNKILRKSILEIISFYEYVVIDCEAGLEQINRRVLDNVTHLIVVSDGSKRSILIAKNIIQLAKKKMTIEKYGIILNKIKSKDNLLLDNIKPICLLPVSSTISKFDELGISLLSVHDQDDFYKKIKEVMKKFLR